MADEESKCKMIKMRKKRNCNFTYIVMDCKLLLNTAYRMLHNARGHQLRDPDNERQFLISYLVCPRHMFLVMAKESVLILECLVLSSITIFNAFPNMPQRIKHIGLYCIKYNYILYVVI